MVCLHPLASYRPHNLLISHVFSQGAEGKVPEMRLRAFCNKEESGSFARHHSVSTVSSALYKIVNPTFRVGGWKAGCELNGIQTDSRSHRFGVPLNERNVRIRSAAPRVADKFEKTSSLARLRARITNEMMHCFEEGADRNRLGDIGLTAP